MVKGRTLGVEKEVAATANLSTGRGCPRANIPPDLPIGLFTVLKDRSCQSDGSRV
jgi:hypothetical protein